MIETIVVGIGPADAPRAEGIAGAVADIAGPTRATVHLTTVLRPADVDELADRLDYDDPPPMDALVRRLNAVRNTAAALVDADRPYGFPIEVHGLVAERIVDRLIAFAEACNADRLVVGGRTRTPVGKAVFGSTAQAVLGSAPCPVVFVRGGPAEGPRGQPTTGSARRDR